MHNFFHGWRRKAGCILLVMACAMTGLWIRSYVVEDHLPSISYDLRSREGGVEESDVVLHSSHYSGSTDWEERRICWRIPYGFVASPLTLLSAYLILWTPRKRA